MELKGRVLKALSWSAGAKLAGQIVTWAMTIYVIRLLTPEDYGLLAMAAIFISFSQMFCEMGLGTALIQAQEISEKQIRQLFGLVVLVNVSIYIALYASAPVIADYFEEERLVLILEVLAIIFLVQIFEVIPRSLLERELHFKGQSIVQFISRIIGGIVTLILALNGHGVWALVLGNVCLVCIRVVGINLLNPYMCMPIFNFKGMRGLLRFGGMVSAERALVVVHHEADNFIIGKVLGKEILGFYSVAKHLASLPMQKVMGMINPVSLAAFSKVQQYPEKVASYLCKVIGMACLFVFPMFFGISSIAPELVAVFLGAKWEPAILPLQILCLVMPIRVIGMLLPSALRGIGRPDVSMTNMAIAAVSMSGVFLIGVQWGMLGVCIGWISAYPLVFLVMLQRAGRVTGVGVLQVFSSMIRPGVCAAIMWLLVFVSSMAFDDSLVGSVRLFILVVVGGISYTVTSFMFNRHGLNEARDILRNRK